jgi:hypothetical protein
MGPCLKALASNFLFKTFWRLKCNAREAAFIVSQLKVVKHGCLSIVGESHALTT